MSVQRIIDCIDKHLNKNNLDSINPVDAGALLDRAGLLNDSAHRPGLPLRKLLRDGMIPHACQPGGKGSGWVIPHSGGKGMRQPTVNPKPRKAKTLERSVIGNTTTLVSSSAEIASALMDVKNQKSVGEIDRLVPNVPGMYCIRIKNASSLPAPFNRLLKERGHDLIYIGIASQSLRRRMLGQELRARGHGTFFRSMGAILGYMPPAGSLIGKSNQKNYKFSAADNARIIEWMNTHLAVHWVTMSNGWDQLESQLIKQHRPLVNIAKNPSALVELSQLRKRCVEVACGRQ
jgi:hypothetical protein